MSVFLLDITIIQIMNNKKITFTTILLFLTLLPAISFAQDMAYPVEGDGIFSFLRRWNRIDKSYVDEFKQLNADRINAEGGLELGVVYLIPPLHPGDVYPPEDILYETVNPQLFGEKYSILENRSKRLKNTCFYIISGHGGSDPGAITQVEGHELHEDEYNYDISLRVARNLMQEGATVYLIIQDETDGIRDERLLGNNNTETAMGQPIPKSQIDRLKQRVEKVNTLYNKNKKEFSYIRAVEIHIDSRRPKEQIDVFFYHANNSASRLTSYTLRDEIMAHYKKHQPNRNFIGDAKHRDLYVLNNFAPPSIMIEIGNFQNVIDRKRILDPNNRQAIANWLTRGFIKDFEYNHKKQH